jgi:hypothetical protein
VVPGMVGAPGAGMRRETGQPVIDRPRTAGHVAARGRDRGAGLGPVQSRRSEHAAMWALAKPLDANPGAAEGVPAQALVIPPTLGRADRGPGGGGAAYGLSLGFLARRLGRSPVRRCADGENRHLRSLAAKSLCHHPALLMSAK